MTQHWDAIVVGLGGLGTVVSHDLAAAGLSTLGLDRFQPGHDRGSSHGATRVIRKAYFEHPDYVPLLHRSYERWFSLEEKTSQSLFFQSGVLELGPEFGEVVPGVLRAAAQHQLKVEALSGQEVEARFPGIKGLDEANLVGVYEPDGGYLLVEDCVRAWFDQATNAGANLRWGAAVTHWGTHRDGFEVVFGEERFTCTRLVLCPGAWASQLLPKTFAQHLQVKRKPLLWYEAGPRYLERGGFPVWLFELPGGVFYGFPTRDRMGFKAARHSAGLDVSDPLQLDRNLHSYDRDPVEAFLKKHLPDVETEQLNHHAVCMYTLSPDLHPLVGEIEPGLVVAAGLSGHGFKMVPGLGEAIAQIARGEAPNCALDIFRPRRFIAPPKPL